MIPKIKQVMKLMNELQEEYNVIDIDTTVTPKAQISDLHSFMKLVSNPLEVGVETLEGGETKRLSYVRDGVVLFTLTHDDEGIRMRDIK